MNQPLVLVRFWLVQTSLYNLGMPITIHIYMNGGGDKLSHFKMSIFEWFGPTLKHSQYLELTHLLQLSAQMSPDMWHFITVYKSTISASPLALSISISCFSLAIPYHSFICYFSVFHIEHTLHDVHRHFARVYNGACHIRDTQKIFARWIKNCN